MPRLTLKNALTYVDPPFHFKRGQPQEVTEPHYHRMTLSGRYADPDRSFESIPATTLAKLPAGTVVTVVRSMGLGDVLMVLPVIRALARDYPQLHFDYAVGSNYVPLLEGIPFIRQAHSIIAMAGATKNVIELRGLSERHTNRKTMDRIDIFASYCNVRVTDYSMPVVVSDEEFAAGEALIGSDRPSIALTVRGSSHHRTWPLELVQEFARLAAADGYCVVALDGNPHEMPTDPGIVNLTGQLSVPQVKCVIAAADVVIAPDTGLVHLAEAVGTRCLAIYSTTPPALRIGHYKHVKALWRKDLPCTPCHDRGCEPMPCLREITPEIVLDALHRWDALPIDSNPRTFAMIQSTDAPASAA